MSDPAVPPGPSPYPTPGAAPAIDPPRGLATAAVVMAAAVTAVQVGVALIALTLGDLSGTVTSVTAYGVVSLTFLPVTLSAYVVTGLWLYRARTNTDGLSNPNDHARSPVWVWLGWWVPVVNLWFPFQVVRDVQKVSVRAAGQPAVDLRLWWGAWIAWAIVSRVQSRLDIPLMWLDVISAVLLVVALWRWILIIRRITEAQTTVAQRAVAA